MGVAETAPAGVQAVAEACNLDPRRVQQLVQEGALPRAARGVYDVDACLRAYVRYLQAAVQSKATLGDEGEVVTTKNAKAQLTQYQADLKRLELAERRGSVIAIDDHERILSTLIIETKARVMAIAPRVAPKVIGLSSRIMVQATIEEEAKLALTELAQRTPTLPAAADGASEAAAPPTVRRARKAKTTAKRRRTTKQKAAPEVAS